MSETRNSSLLDKFTVLVVICCCCLSAQAKYSGGTGEPNNPYRIADYNDLCALAADTSDYDKNFVMINDINMAGITGSQFNIIGNSTNSFTGVFDGNNLKIINFTYSTATLDNIGLFGVIEGPACIIKNIQLENVTIYTSQDTAGSLVGLVTNQARVTNCSVQNGLVDGSSDIGGLAGSNEGGIVSYCKFEGVVEASSTVGGLVGDNSFDSTITHSFTEGTVIGFAAVGGLVGENSFNSVISQCYSLSDVQHGANAHLYFGGLVGTNSIGGSIIDCYAYGNVTGGGRTGGLVGSNDNFIRNCYSTGQVTGTSAVGGFAGENEETIMNSFWNTDTCSRPSGVGLGSGSGITGINTSLMQTETTFTDVFWDFSTPIWRICDANTYPFLAWSGYFCDYHDSGTGEPNDPYIIWSSFQFNDIGNHPNDWDKHYKMTADIDMSQYTSDQFNTIGCYHLGSTPDLRPFTGTFNGDGYSIKNLSYKRLGGAASTGIFEYISGEGACIRNLRLYRCNLTVDSSNINGLLIGVLEAGEVINCQVIESNTSKGSGLIGQVENGRIVDCFVQGGHISGCGMIQSSLESEVIRCYSTATVGTTGSNSSGLIGYVSGGVISQCYATGNVKALFSAGGLIVQIQNQALVENCYATGDVETHDDNWTYIGGFIGRASSDCQIRSCYSVGRVTPSIDDHVGGFIGFGSAEVLSCFWDVETSGQSGSVGGTPKTTAEMQTMSTFTNAGWDFVGEPNNGRFDIWAMPEQQGYPLIWWQLDPLPDLPEFSGGSGTVANPFIISSPSELAYINNPRLIDKFYRLVSDIDGNETNLIPIGRKLYPFVGVFDGNNHTVYNLKIDTNDRDYVGLFGYADEAAQIMNTSVVDANLTGNDYVGGLIGFNKGAAVSNCYSSVNVIGSQYIGGLIGYSEYGPVSDCQTTGKVSGYRYVGGLIGKASRSEISGCSSNSVSSSTYMTGGLIGYFIDSNMTDCSSSGTVTGLDVGYAIGGLVGYHWRCTIFHSNSSADVYGDNSIGGLTGTTSFAKIYDSYAVGTASGNYALGGFIGSVSGSTDIQNCYAIGDVSGGDEIGGFIGYNSGGDTTNCYAVGNVFGETEIGGFIGDNSGSNILNCYATGDISGESKAGGFIGNNLYGRNIIYCYSTGTVNTPANANDVGGFLGLNGGVVCSSYWDIETSGWTDSSGGIGKNTEEMYSVSTYMGWGCESAWTIDSGNDYPRLWWENMPGEPMTTPNYGGGTGELNDPHLIYTAEQLSMIGATVCHFDRHFKLLADIDLSDKHGSTFNMIGVPYIYPFTGTFDGNSHRILNFNVGYKEGGYPGLFRHVDGPDSEIKNLGLVDPNINGKRYGGILVGRLVDGTICNCWVEGGSVSYDGHAGGLVGSNYGTVFNCQVTANVRSIGNSQAGGLVGTNGGSIIDCDVNCQVFGGLYVGGITGVNAGDGKISNCCASGAVSGVSYVGGLVGINHDAASINSSFAICSVSGNKRLGGLVGSNYGDTIKNCYAIGDVTGSSDVGGLVGSATTGSIAYCYAAVCVDANDNAGGLMGANYNNGSSFEICFWDSDVNPGLTGVGNQTDPLDVMWRTTAQMRTQSTFTDYGWDFNNIWDICEGTNYPRHIWQIPSGDFLCPDGVNFLDYAFFTARWMDQNCDLLNDYCQGTDLDQLGTVDINDFRIFADNWLAGF